MDNATRAASTTVPRFVCEQCRTAYTANSLEIGKSYRCRRCGHTTRYRGTPAAPGNSTESQPARSQASTPTLSGSTATAAAPSTQSNNLEDSALLELSDEDRHSLTLAAGGRVATSADFLAPDAGLVDEEEPKTGWLIKGFDHDSAEPPETGRITAVGAPAPLVTPAPPIAGDGASLSEIPTAPVGPPPLRTFARYEILSELGRGGMGVVYKARDPKLGRMVAIKTLIGGTAATLAAIKRFEREARTVARLSHPCIVPIYEYGEFEGTRFIVMEFVEGTTLVDVTKGERGNTRTLLMMMAKITRAIAYAHEQGIVHRDLKPANVMIDARREPRVMDFGLAKDLDGAQSMLSQTGDLMGTPNYMAPEQADGRIHEIDSLSDVFSLGAILYELLTGSPPFQGASLAETLRQVLFEDPPTMRTLNPKLEPELERITLKALEKSRDARYPSAAALADDLDAFLAGQQISIAAPSVLTRVAKTVQRKQRWARAAAMAVLAAAAIGAGVAWLLRDPLGSTRERLASHDPEVRQRAVESLATDQRSGRIKDPKLAARAFDLLAGALSDPTPAVRLAATRGTQEWKGFLEKNNDARRTALARKFENNLENDVPPEVREATLDTIDKLHLTEASEALIFVISDAREDQAMTLHAVHTLGEVGKLSAFPALMQVLYRGGVYRVEAQAAIDRLTEPHHPGQEIGLPDGDKFGLGDLPAALRGFERDVAGNRARSIEGLEELGMSPSPERDIDAFAHTLQQGTPTQRLAAVYHLSERRIPGAAKLLLAAVRDVDDGVAKAAAAGLVAVDGANARDDLEGVLKTGGARARGAAASGLGELAKPESVDPLIVALGVEIDASASIDIMRALAVIGDRRAAPHLIEKLGSSDPAVKRAAHGSLARLAGQDLGEDAASWRAWVRAGS